MAAFATAVLLFVALEPIISASTDDDLDGIPTVNENADVWYLEVKANVVQPATGSALQPGIHPGASWDLSLPNWKGVSKGGYVNVSLVHNTNMISARVGYKGQSGWIDRPFWDPGKNEVVPEAAVTPGDARSVTVVVAKITNGIKATRAEFHLGGVLMSMDTVTPDGYVFDWSWNTAAVVNGDYAVQVRFWTVDGKSSWSNRTITVDNTLPTAALLTPPAGATVSNTVLVTAQASDANLDRVEFLVGGALVKTDWGVPDCTNSYCFNWNTKGLANGAKTLAAVAYDRAGNKLQKSISVTVNNPGCPCPPEPGTGPISGAGPGVLTASAPPAGISPSTGTLGALYAGVGAETSWGRSTGAPVTGKWGQGGGSTPTVISMDLTKDTASLTQAQRDAGLLGPAFGLADFLNPQWRVTIKSWTPLFPLAGVLTSARVRMHMGTDPNIADTDQDLLKDGEEVFPLGGRSQTAPFLPDTERDGLTDGDEVRTYLTDPLSWDTDQDGLTDYDEVTQYHLFSVTPTTGSLVDPGTWSHSFTVPVGLSKAHVIKIEATTVLVRDVAFLAGHDMNDSSYVNTQDDLFFGQYLKAELQRSGAPVSGTINETHGKAEAVEYQGSSVRIEERRIFVVALANDVPLSSGSHTVILTLRAAPGSISVSFLQVTLTVRGLDPKDADSDNDGAKDGREGRLGTAALRVDSDGDGLYDGWVDANANLLYEGTETKGEVGTQTGGGGYGTDPTRVDTDNDGLWDGPNVGSNLGEIPRSTNPLSNDTDGDELTDGAEVTVHTTNPLLKDTDGDTLWDSWELDEGLNPKDGTDGASDPDNDGLTTAQEFPLRTHRTDPDSDDDGLLDGQEIDGVLLRTTVQEGMVTSAYYGGASEWVAYAGYRYTTNGGSVTDPPASSPANSRSATMRLLAVLDDGSHVFRNLKVWPLPLVDELYVWTPGSDHGDQDQNGTGDGILQGAYYKFTKTATPEAGMAKPLAGYYQREFYAGSDPLDRDTDEDGITDGAEIGWGLDTDSDGLQNRVDTDSDGDKVADGQEPDWSLDTDGDGKKNMVDSDSDGDGILDGTEALWSNDTDLDGRVNMLDTDSDGDGLQDGTEDANKNGTLQPLETSPVSMDTDGDGLADGVEVNPFADADSDGFANANDGDSDADGIPDGNETFPYVDTDGDGIKNVYDSDADADGIPDGAERASGTNELARDTDNDELCDGANVTLPGGATCVGEKPYASNPLDNDTDDDGVKDGQEVLRDHTSPTNGDTDHDGLPDGFEANFNPGQGRSFNGADASDASADWESDGLTNLKEYLVNKQAAHNFDGDSLTDFVDADDDNDGIPTASELLGLNPFMSSDASRDFDRDGISNLDEYNAGLDPTEPDTDMDGLWDGSTVIVDGVTYQGETTKGTNPTNPDTDADRVFDGNEVLGWHVYIIRPDDTVEERSVTSDPLDSDTDNDGLGDGDEYLRTDPRTWDTDADGLKDTLPWLHSKNLVPAGLDEDPVVPEDVPPKLGTIGQTHTLEWGWWGFVPVVVHTWLTVTVTATDNAAVRDVTFRFVDNGATVVDRYNGDSTYTATFEIDFWADYTWGYEVSATASDLAGNIMATQTGGGLQYVVGQIVAGILAFLAGAEMAGGVLGFFMGFGQGLFEDLTIFLHLQEMWDAIQQLPKILGMILADPSILLSMVVDMVNGILAKANLVNPFGPSSKTATEFADVLVKFFWHLFDPSVVVPFLTTADLFALSFAVSHLVGYFIQQFVVGTGLAKAFGKLQEAGKLSKLGSALEKAKDAVVGVAGKVKNVAASAAKKFLRGTADALDEALRKLGLKFDDGIEGLLRRAATHGCSFCGIDDLIKKFGKSNVETMLKREARRWSQTGVEKFSLERQIHILERHSSSVLAGPLGKGSPFPSPWSDQKILDAAEHVADNPLKTTSNTFGRPGWIRYGVYDGEEIAVVIYPGDGIWTAFPAKIP